MHDHGRSADATENAGTADDRIVLERLPCLGGVLCDYNSLLVLVTITIALN